ncbi:hypothetical protein C5167_002618 [Papaver somniferum]|uniref:Telomere repeat-binding protein 1-6-like ubiquitin-like domain-containing protein n=1 Tax=Papaver somniferum TaxID=3469 RepID=A0A4Y7L182_PAPSO|nr:hypothetical protein C5167_002618 [Papaver somniferum]
MCSFVVPQSGDRCLHSISGAAMFSMSCLTSKVLFFIYPTTLSVCSFVVPELFNEIPEIATVGSPKKTIIEAVTADLTCVAVVVKGNKVSRSPMDAEPDIFGDSLYPPVTRLENFIDSENDPVPLLMIFQLVE